MSNAPFRPFETHLDLDATTALVRDALSGAEDGELFIERARSEALVLDDGRVKTASYDSSEGFGLRAVRGEVAGYAHASEISEAALKRAVDTARLAIGDGGGIMAPPPRAPTGTFIRMPTPSREPVSRSSWKPCARSTPSPVISIAASCR